MSVRLDNRRPVGPRTREDRAAAARRLGRDLLEAIDGDQVRRVVLLVPDHHARFAAVELSAEFVRDVVVSGGYGACTYIFAWDVHRQPVEVPELARYLGGYGDLTLRPDFASLVPWSAAASGQDQTVAVICDAEWRDGTPVDVAPRQVLRECLAEAERMGLVPSVGLEYEVVFADADGVPLTGQGLDYALGGIEPLSPVLTAIHTAADRCGLGVESARGECHPGQYEIVLRHRDALAACDDAMLLRHLVCAAAHPRGVSANYLAAPRPGQGNSCHVHLSLSTMAGSPIGATEDGGVPEELRHFLGGVLAAAADLSALWAPTLNSYVRLRTAPFSPRVVRWGVDDRTAAVRLAGHGPSLRLECRFAGADAQPHLVVAGLLAAGLSGIRRRLTPPAPGEVVGELAGTPWEALRRWTDEPLPTELLGAAVVTHQAALLGAELTAICETVSDVQRGRGRLRA